MPHSVGEAYSLLLEEHSDLDDSLQCGLKAHEIFRSMASSDPSNWLASVNVGFTEIGIGEVLVLKGRIREAMSYVRRAMNLFETRQHKTPYDIARQAECYSTLAKAHAALADHEPSPLGKTAHLDLGEARAWLDKSVRAWQQDANRGSPDPMGGHEGDLAREEVAKWSQLWRSSISRAFKGVRKPRSWFRRPEAARSHSVRGYGNGGTRPPSDSDAPSSMGITPLRTNQIGEAIFAGWQDSSGPSKQTDPQCLP